MRTEERLQRQQGMFSLQCWHLSPQAADLSPAEFIRSVIQLLLQRGTFCGQCGAVLPLQLKNLLYAG